MSSRTWARVHVREQTNVEPNWLKMSLKNPTEVVLGLIFLTLSGATFLLMADFPSGNRFQGMGPAFYPGLLAALLGVLSLFLVLKGVFTSGGEELIEEERNKEPSILFGMHLKVPGTLVVIVCLYLVLTDMIGFLWITPIFLVATMKTLRAGWALAFITAISLTVLIYIIFGVALRVPLPEGVLTSG